MFSIQLSTAASLGEAERGPGLTSGSRKRNKRGVSLMTLVMGATWCPCAVPAAPSRCELVQMTDCGRHLPGLPFTKADHHSQQLTLPCLFKELQPLLRPKIVWFLVLHLRALCSLESTAGIFCSTKYEGDKMAQKQVSWGKWGFYPLAL